jgi:prepilin-type N-terminal cleavage/methylation domain-containing protein
MRRALGKRLRLGGGEAGFTLIELLVASTMGVVVLGAVGSLVVSAMQEQPKISEKAQHISTARWVLERLTREIRNGVKVDRATASSVSFETYVRHTTCGGTTVLAETSPSIECEVTYTCSGSSCTRIEAAPGVYTGTERTIFEGLNNSSSVFTYKPTETDPTYIGVTLTIPSPSGGSSGLTVSDGASLRNAILTN